MPGTSGALPFRKRDRTRLRFRHGPGPQCLRGRIVLLKREGPVDPAAPVAPRPFTIDVLGGTTQGNVKASNASGTFRYLIAKLGDHAQLKATFTGRYENFSRAVSASRYDLVVNGGLGVAF